MAYICLAALLVFAAVTYVNRITDERPHFDGKINVKYAYNLAKHGRFSDSGHDDSGEMQPTMRREPLYPAVLALWMKVIVDFSRTDVDCLLSDDDRCKTTREALKWPQSFLLLLLTAATFLAGSRLSGSHLVGLASACFVGFNPYYLLMVDRYYTEIPAALLLLTHCYALAQLTRGSTLRLWLTAGASLGLLILTKAVFHYWLILLIPFLLLLALRRMLPWKSVAVLVVSASILPALWITRNAVLIGEPYLSERGGGVLSIRAEYTRISWPEYWAAYAYYTPMFRKQASRILGQERFAPFDRQNPEGYYRTVKNGKGLVKSRVDDDNETAMREYAFKVLLQNWPKQLALIPLFAYRGVFQIDDSRRFLVQATLPAWGFLFGSIAALYSRRTRYLLFGLPVWFSIGFHAVLTHFIPRYSMPLLPVMIICAFWAGWMILQSCMPRVSSNTDSKVS